MRISPDNWGPAFWKTFHVACLAATNKDEIQQFVEGFKLAIPCGSCRIHFAQILSENPLPADEFFNWSVDIHNLVNATLDKRILSYEEALIELQKEPSSLDIKIISLLIIFTIIIVYLILNRR